MVEQNLNQQQSEAYYEAVQELRNNSYIVQKDPISSGSYGVILDAQKNGKRLAIKVQYKSEKASLNKALEQMIMDDVRKQKFEFLIQTVQPSYSLKKSFLIFMPMINLLDLERVMQNPQLQHQSPSDEVVQYVGRQLLWGVQFLHKHKIAHLDIKPGNIFLHDPFQAEACTKVLLYENFDEIIENQVEVKLGDLGSAMFLNEAASLAQSNQLEGSLMVTLPFQPPAYHRKPFVDLKQDLWSVAQTLYLFKTRLLIWRDGHPANIPPDYFARKQFYSFKHESKSYQIVINDPTIEFIHFLFKCFKVKKDDLTSECPDVNTLINQPFFKNQSLHRIFQYFNMPAPDYFLINFQSDECNLQESLIQALLAFGNLPGFSLSDPYIEQNVRNKVIRLLRDSQCDQ